MYNFATREKRQNRDSASGGAQGYSALSPVSVSPSPLVAHRYRDVSVAASDEKVSRQEEPATGFWGSLGQNLYDQASGLWTLGKGLATSPVATVSGMYQGIKQQGLSGIASSLIDPYKQRWDRGDYLGMLGYGTAEMLPNLLTGGLGMIAKGGRVGEVAATAGKVAGSLEHVGDIGQTAKAVGIAEDVAELGSLTSKVDDIPLGGVTGAGSGYIPVPNPEQLPVPYSPSFPGLPDPANVTVASPAYPSFFGGAGMVDDVADNAAHSATQGYRLREYYRMLEEYGAGGVRHLPDERIRFYGELDPARNPGTMMGRRFVREWDPYLDYSRSWHETLDNDLRVRQVRPQFGDQKGPHFMFDEFGNYIQKW